MTISNHNNDDGEIYYLIGFQRLSDHGYALPVFATSKSANQMYVAISEPEGDTLGHIKEFRIFASTEVEYVPIELSFPAPLGAKWINVFLIENRIFAGDSKEIYDSASLFLDYLKEFAPITLLHLSSAVDDGNLEQHARIARAYAEKETGFRSAETWAISLLQRYVGSYLLRNHSNLSDLQRNFVVGLNLRPSSAGLNSPPLGQSDRALLAPLLKNALSAFAPLSAGLGLQKLTLEFLSEFESNFIGDSATSIHRTVNSLGEINNELPNISEVYDLVDRVKSYDSGTDEALMHRAYVYAVRTLGSDSRRRLDFSSVIRVPGILTDYKIDHVTISAAMMHALLLETSITQDDIAKIFGDEVAGLVLGVTKLSKLDPLYKDQRQSADIRDFMLSIAKDARVILIKLAERLDTMRYLEWNRHPAKREIIARETLDVYAPLARILGCHQICTELEELSFKHLNPKGREAVIKRLENTRSNLGQIAQVTVDDIVAILRKEDIPANVFSRERSPFSIWREIQYNNGSFNRISDIYAVRIVVESENDCYRTLGLIHRSWPSIPEKFHDLISSSESHQDRPLSTTIITQKGVRIQVQISSGKVELNNRANDYLSKIDQVNRYFDGMESDVSLERHTGLQAISSILMEGGDPKKVRANAPLSIFEDRIFALTPKGRILSFPLGATALDFAYAIHTDLGNHSVAFKINGAFRAPQHAISSGDVVEVIPGSERMVEPSWLNFVRTRRARSSINREIRRNQRSELILRGKELLEEFFGKVPPLLFDRMLNFAVRRLNVTDERVIFEMVASNIIRPEEVFEVAPSPSTLGPPGKRSKKSTA